MYLPSNTPILQDQRAAAARHGAESDARVQAMRRTSACGRARLFNTLINPNSVAEALGAGTGLDTAKLQQQTEASRASGIFSTGDAASGGGAGGFAGPSVAEIIASAPEVVSLNRGGGCQIRNPYQPVPLAPAPRPGMPQRAPVIVSTPAGPVSFQGPPSTIQGDYQSQPVSSNALPMQRYTPPPSGGPVETPGLPIKQYMSILTARGLTGYAPPWSDAGVLPNGGVQDAGVGVMGWISEHPWLSLLIAGGGAYALSRRSRR
jgi:hypothetical protein